MKKIFLLIIPVLASCSTAHISPNIVVQPGRGVTIERFIADDNHCREISRTSIINGQRSIDAIYMQCMFSRGHLVPGRAVAIPPPPPPRNR